MLKSQLRPCDVAFEEAKIAKRRARFARYALKVFARAQGERRLHEQQKSRAFGGQTLDEAPGDKARKPRQKNRLVELHS